MGAASAGLAHSLAVERKERVDEEKPLLMGPYLVQDIGETLELFPPTPHF